MFSDTWVYYRIRTTIKNAELLEDKELKGKQCKRPFNLIRGPFTFNKSYQIRGAWTER